MLSKPGYVIYYQPLRWNLDFEMMGGGSLAAGGGGPTGGLAGLRGPAFHRSGLAFSLCSAYLFRTVLLSESRFRNTKTPAFRGGEAGECWEG
ncbi:MAG: hypothetical protein JWO82_2020 [Akkermansiaceae bacterium]|nr:hypothetical protein [Akkermansiaceae bacterium]